MTSPTRVISIAAWMRLEDLQEIEPLLRRCAEAHGMAIDDFDLQPTRFSTFDVLVAADHPSPDELIIVDFAPVCAAAFAEAGGQSTHMSVCDAESKAARRRS